MCRGDERYEAFNKINRILQPEYFLHQQGNAADVFESREGEVVKDMIQHQFYINGNHKAGELYLHWNLKDIVVFCYHASFQEATKKLTEAEFNVEYKWE